MRLELLKVVENAFEIIGARRFLSFLRLVGIALGLAVLAWLVAVVLAVGGGLRLAVAAFLVVVFLVLVLLAVGLHAVLGELERAKKITHQAAEALLILGEAVEPLEELGAALLDRAAPHVDERLGAFRRRHAGEAFADHQGDGILERRIGTRFHLLDSDRAHIGPRCAP